MTTFKPLFLLLLLALALTASPIDWEKAQELYPGVRLHKLQMEKPRLIKAYLMRIDLALPGLRFTSTPRSPGWGNPMPDSPDCIIRTLRQSTMDFMKWNRAPWSAGGRGRDMIVAFNSVPWTPWKTPFTQTYGNPAGLMISNGVVVADNPQNNHAQFVVYRNGRVDIVSETIPPEDYGKIWVTAGGFQVIMTDGTISPKCDKSIHPRMAYGLSKDRRWLYVLAVDGRQNEWSVGAQTGECAIILRDAGASDAINMDGGGSTTLCCWDYRANKPVMINQHGGNAVRKVGGNIGIYLAH